jgi:tRNA wybutosine-synthesizing protein 4
MTSDAGVQLTTEEASISKLSSVNLGYYRDDQIGYFVRSDGRRRSPIVNRGYYSRVAGMRMCVAKFLRCSEHAGYDSCQIVNLGAGLDSIAFWLATSPELPFIAKRAVIFEVDYPAVIAKKSAIIARCPELSRVFSPISLAAQGELRSDRYRLIGADLRVIEEVRNTIREAGLAGNVPTLFLAECALIFMEASASDALLRWVAIEAVPDAFTALTIYEQTNPTDAFGRMMVENLNLRGCPLLGIHAYPTVESQRKRFVEVAGFGAVSIADMNDIYDNQLDKEEIKRVSKVELFDEFEEWRLMQAHYFIAVASRCTHADAPSEFTSLINMWSYTSC